MTTDDQKRIRIAEFCGWQWWRFKEPPEIGGYFTDLLSPNSGDWAASKRFQGEKVSGPLEGESPDLSGLPDYLNSLDAIAQAEARLTAEQWDRYCELLGGSLRSCVSASARQRAEALIKIIQS